MAKERVQGCVVVEVYDGSDTLREVTYIISDDGYRVYARQENQQPSSDGSDVVFEYKHSLHPHVHKIIEQIMRLL